MIKKAFCRMTLPFRMIATDWTCDWNRFIRKNFKLRYHSRPSLLFVRRIVSTLVDKGVLKSESACAAAPRISGRARVAMAAGAVPGKDRVAARPSHSVD